MKIQKTLREQISDAKLVAIDAMNVGVALQRNNYQIEAKLFYEKAASVLVVNSQDPKGIPGIFSPSGALQSNPETDRRMLKWANRIMNGESSCDCTRQEEALEVFMPVFIYSDHDDDEDEDEDHDELATDPERPSRKRNTSLSECVSSMPALETCQMTLLYNLATLAASLDWVDHVEHFAQEMKTLFTKRIEPYGNLTSCEDAFRLCMVAKFYAAFFRIQQNDAKCDTLTQSFKDSVIKMEESVLLGCGMLRGSMLTASLYVTLAQVLHHGMLLGECNRVLIEAKRALDNEPTFLQSRLLYCIHSLMGTGAPAA
jgi:hypothetical protein